MQWNQETMTVAFFCCSTFHMFTQALVGKLCKTCRSFLLAIDHKHVWLILIFWYFHVYYIFTYLAILVWGMFEARPNGHSWIGLFWRCRSFCRVRRRLVFGKDGPTTRGILPNWLINISNISLVISPFIIHHDLQSLHIHKVMSVTDAYR